MKPQTLAQSQIQKTPLFISKLQEILNETDNSSIISWTQNGLSFQIKNSKTFQEILLPRYFRHSRMSSFVRQLNMYGFHKNKTTKEVIVFSHQSFQKDNLENAIIIRKPQGPILSRKDQSTAITEPATTTASIEVVASRQNINSNVNQQKLDLPISDLMLDLVDQVNSQNLILDCDIKNRVNDLIRSSPYNKIDKKFVPFILDSLGLDSQPSMRNLNQLTFNSQLFLKSHNFIESLQLIL